jgi:hypothetical protein
LRCALCDSKTRKDAAVLVEISELPNGFVCERCLLEGSEEITSVLLERAGRLEGQADRLHDMARRGIELPTFGDFIVAEFEAGKRT